MDPKRPYLARLILGFALLATEVWFLLASPDLKVEYTFSSFVVTFALLLQLRFGTSKDGLGIADLVVFVFNWLFLDLAPKIQLVALPHRLVNTSSIVAERVLITNFVCAASILSFTWIYSLCSRRAAEPAMPKSEVKRYGSGGIAVAMCLATALVVALGRFAYRGEGDAGPTPVTLIINNVFLFLPTALLLYLLHDSVTNRNWTFSRWVVLGVLVLLVLVTENPLTEKRNTLGPVYMSLIVVALQKRLRSQNRRLFLLVFGMVLVFPAISVYTHNHQKNFSHISLVDFLSTIEDHYLQTHYDAWANIYSTIEMTTRTGLTLGRQALGTILFFVPSSLWHAKPLTTGVVIANYLIGTYSMWFTNLSAPLAAEGYVDFGIFGVLIYGALIAFGAAALDRRIATRAGAAFPLGVFYSLYLMYIMRGALMPAVAYGVGKLIAFFIAYRLILLGGQSADQPVSSSMAERSLRRLALTTQ